MLTELANPFAASVACAVSPMGGADGRELLERMALEGYRRMLNGFVQQAPARMDLPPDLSDVLVRFAEKISRFEDIWRPSLGALYHARRNPSPAFLGTAAVETAVQAHRWGLPGSWRIEFASPSAAPLGERVIREVVEISAHADGSSLRLEWMRAGGDRGALQIAVAPDSWSEDRRALELAPFGHRTEEDAARALAASDDGMAKALSAGLELLDRASPEYAGWVRGIVRQVAPLECQGRVVSSWSSLHYPGLISLTLFDSPLDVAETLVHEASHQRYHLLDRSIPLVKQEAVEDLHFSPIKQCPRPLPMVLLAFHAFCNIALLFDDFYRAGVLDRAGFRYHMSDLRNWLPAMAQTLGAARGLTADGEMLWRDLHSRLESALFGEEASVQ